MRDPRRIEFDEYRFSEDDEDFESDDPSRESTPVTDNPRGGRFFVHRKKRIELKPLSEDQVKSDQRYHMRKMFRLAAIHENADKHYQCILCLPKFKLIWTSKTTNQHLEKHVRSVHNSQITRYLALATTGKGYKRKRSPSPVQSTSQSQHSVSKRMKSGSGATPVLWAVYSQADFVEDTVTEVIMNMLPFEVSGF
jgi:hypothetical protein